MKSDKADLSKLFAQEKNLRTTEGWGFGQIFI